MPWNGRILRLGAIVVGCAVLLTGIRFLAQELRGPVGSDYSAVSTSCPRPYSAGSPWNSEIGQSPEILADETRRLARIDGPLTSDPTQYTYPVYEVDGETPRTSVTVDGLFSHVRGDQTLRIQKGGTVRVPVPPGARAAAGTDAQVVLVDQESGDEWGAWRLRRHRGGWRIENGYRYNVRWDAVPPRDPGGTPFGSRGAGIPYLAGLVRPCELEAGRIDHALAFAYDYPSPDHVYPATKSDGASSGREALPEGTRLQLDPSLMPADLEDMGCLDACLVIAQALQEYGMYVVDNAGRPKVMLEYEETASWGGRVDASTVSPLPLTSFRVVAQPRGRL